MSHDLSNDQAIRKFLYPKKVMAEEVLHKNPGAKILPTQPLPDELPPIEGMIAILHKTCGGIAFYYTHVPIAGEMMLSTHARTVDGDAIEPGGRMFCSACNSSIEGANYLQVRKSDYEAAK
ncbi:MAG TPA: hypothetical protein VMW70_13945 [Burkholderiales bacterium]|nr:hypothetical protein [Burkholderiales bacterium]